MNNNNRNTFIQTIQKALKKPDSTRDLPDLFNIRPADLDAMLARYGNRSQAQYQALKDELKTRAEAVQIELSLVDNAESAAVLITRLVLDKSPEWGDIKHVAAWAHPLIKELNLDDRLAKENIGITYTRLADSSDEASERARLREMIENSFIGVTSADFVVAHTATMVMKSRPDQLRSVSLVPSIHVCVIKENQLVADLEELYTRLQWEPGHKEEGLTTNMTFISAPSKTGDIELVMVNGAHGPREVHLIVIAG